MVFCRYFFYTFILISFFSDFSTEADLEPENVFEDFTNIVYTNCNEKSNSDKFYCHNNKGWYCIINHCSFFLIYGNIGALSAEGSALLQIYYNSNISATALNQIIQLIKDPQFHSSCLEPSMSIIFEKEKKDNLQPVYLIPFLYYLLKILILFIAGTSK
jgi:hypothetical protein